MLVCAGRLEVAKYCMFSAWQTGECCQAVGFVDNAHNIQLQLCTLFTTGFRLGHMMVCIAFGFRNQHLFCGCSTLHFCDRNTQFRVVYLRISVRFWLFWYFECISTLQVNTSCIARCNWSTPDCFCAPNCRLARNVHCSHNFVGIVIMYACWAGMSFP